ncbi:MarC family protein [Ktedonospora formicarum]|uniref:UPF0056 membrane protein n=1 Tax=Ktedonospora formicarum TaxID=2778364 RepID=A0A8J3MU53_9CHLR|nr:MarC family protein [Ktedonospora formicarum]GHO46273.1 hypothetical protein KSX_44360 [Ktedonospora formicarum]
MSLSRKIVVGVTATAVLAVAIIAGMKFIPAQAVGVFTPNFFQLVGILDVTSIMLVFWANTRELSKQQVRRIIIRVMVYVAMMALFSATIGPYALKLLGIPIGALRTAGGLLFIIMGLEILVEKLWVALKENWVNFMAHLALIVEYLENIQNLLANQAQVQNVPYPPIINGGGVVLGALRRLVVPFGYAQTVPIDLSKSGEGDPSKVTLGTPRFEARLDLRRHEQRLPNRGEKKLTLHAIIFTLAFLVIWGPGAMTFVIGAVSETHGVVPLAALGAAIAAALLIVMLAMIFTPKITGRLKEQGKANLNLLTMMLMLVYGFDFLIVGAKNLLGGG